MKFRASINDDQCKEISILNLIDQEEENEETIVDHKKPLCSSGHSYNWSCWNIMIVWETEEVMAEPLTTIQADDPVTCTIYARDKDLFEYPSLKSFKGTVKQDKT
jgi:hypothetical protein